MLEGPASYQQAASSTRMATRSSSHFASSSKYFTVCRVLQHPHFSHTVRIADASQNMDLSIALRALVFGLMAVPVWAVIDCASADSSCAAESAANPSMDPQQSSKSTQSGTLIQKKKKLFTEQVVDQESHVWLVNFRSGGLDEDLSRFCEFLSKQTGDAACTFQGHPSSHGLPIAGAWATRSQLDDVLEHFPEVEFVEPDQQLTSVRRPPILLQAHGGTKQPEVQTQCIGGVWKEGIANGENANLGTTFSASECMDKVKSKVPAANGATWNTIHGDCFAMTEMTKVVSYSAYITCQFESCSTFASETECPSTWCIWDTANVTSTNGQPCQDTPGFSNGYGRGCADYASNKWCTNGGAVAGSEWTLGSKYKFPENNCCVCGKEQACQDTPGFSNGYGRGCADYASNKWCTNGGAVAGSEWTLGSKYKFPENNCCVCGKEQAYTGTCLTTTTTTPNVKSWGLDRIDAENGYDGWYAGKNNSEMGAGVHVYIIDRGVRCSHEEFMPAGRCSHTLRVEQKNITVCDSSWPECAEDADGHGTAVAAVVGGLSLGVAPGANIHSVRLSKHGSSLIHAVDWLAVNAQRPAVLVMSLGWGKGEGEFASARIAIDSVVQGGISVYVAAGNQADDACEHSPPKYDSVMAVMGTRKGDEFQSMSSGGKGTRLDDEFLPMSNSGPCANIFAPGSSIETACWDSDICTESVTGTSIAAPFVAGAAALILGRHPTATPGVLYATIESQAVTGLVSEIPLANTPNKMLYVGNLLTGDYVLATAAPTAAPPSYVYVMTPVGSSSCVGNTVAIEEENQCKLASRALGRNPVHTGKWGSTPGGCIWDQRNKNVFWNKRAGKVNPNQAPICVGTTAITSNITAVDATTTTAPTSEACSSDDTCNSNQYCASVGHCVDYDGEYCESNACGLGDGDCDNDAHCGGDLVCGTDNCREFHSSLPASADCCYLAA
eukprot:TRINITY_DN5754_c0_g2_i2.p1 TRINITY_DN5754_c0_g2~~TRINITY_DN5754_c0_g2_i2.p1  ORF type:complete len:951 (-),score=73.54 TRINITY_DN5754_c0_g2_i2:370-3222(-)